MPTAKKKPATKPVTARKAPAKSTAKKQKPTVEQSFRPSKEKTPFFTYEFTIQSVYWIILSTLVLALGAWVMYLNIKIQAIYDQVEINTNLSETYIVPTIEKAHPEVPKPQQ